MKPATKHTLGRVVLWIGALAALALIIAGLAGVFREKIPAGAPRAERGDAAPTRDGRRAVAAESITEQVVERFPGTVQPVREAVVSSRLLATVRDVLVRPGAAIAEGDPLVRLDDRDLQAREQQAREDLAGAEARLAEATSSVERVRQLHAAGVSPESQLDSAEAAFRAATAEVESARRAAEEAAVALTHATIGAPFDGVVIDRFVDPGDTASPGVPLFKLYDPRQMRLEAYVRESLAVRRSAGESLTVALDALDRRIEGKLVEVVPQAEPGSRSFLLKVSLPAEGDLYPGLFGRLLIPSGTRRSIVVPEGAIVRVGQLTFVDLAGGAGGRRMVVVGAAAGEGRVEVLSGLVEGEQVLAPAP